MDRACCTFNYYNYNSLLRTRVCVCAVCAYQVHTYASAVDFLDLI